jgi:hypothetical protein
METEGVIFVTVLMAVSGLLQTWLSSRSLPKALQAVLSDTGLLDKIENVATSVVPAAALTEANEAIQSLIKVMQIADKVTDQKANTPPITPFNLPPAG